MSVRLRRHELYGTAPDEGQIYRLSHLSGDACLLVVTAMILVEVEHVEEIANSWHVHGDIGVVTPHYWIGQVIAAAAGQWLEMPVTFDELEHGSMVRIRVYHFAATGILGYGNEGDARSVAEEVKRLEEA